MRHVTIALLLLLPLVVIGELDVVELQKTGAITGETYTVTAALPHTGVLRTVHVEQSSSGADTNTVVLKTTDAKGVSLAANTILTLSEHASANAVYPVTLDAVDEGGAVRNDDGDPTVPWFFVGDYPAMTVTNLVAGTTNTVTLRLVIER